MMIPKQGIYLLAPECCRRQHCCCVYA